MAVGRGRLSGIEMLPEAATPIIAWANEQLRDRERTQLEIYQDFYAKLEELRRNHHGELDFSIPSFSAFNRYSIKLATLSRRLDETREISATLAEKFDAKSSDDLTVIAAEAIKTLVFEVITAAGESGVDPKGAMNLANALRAAAQAQGLSTIRRSRVEKEFGEKVQDAVETVQKAGVPVDADTVLALIRKAYRGET
ncbi:phage protein Gp27 family protein [Tianweitania sediminis]|uniref:DUF3486 family protein n=1 Tax=Tianweitania sediminis TaxID=1502156 RepID=A0A8J7ULH9_9HYPH|nr:phage protein Gp27 family protein [Tianweitania sediminis]MBP0439447.1 DUF3486 family protein [Tianweitania sediminis]